MPQCNIQPFKVKAYLIGSPTALRNFMRNVNAGDKKKIKSQMKRGTIKKYKP